MGSEMCIRDSAWKVRLQLGLAYMHEEVLTRVVLLTGKSSFQLKRTSGRKEKILSTVKFPQLYLLESPASGL